MNKEVELVSIVKKEGYNIQLEEPKTIFVPSGTEESDLSHSLKQLRGDYGYMIQIEIT